MNRSALNAGERIELRRRRLGLSRRVVAQLTGRSEEWLRQIEKGSRRLDSIEMTNRLAEVLRLDDPAELTGWPSASRSDACELGLPLTPLKRAIMDHPSTRAFAADAQKPLPTLNSVRTALDQCWTIWHNSGQRYTELAARLPIAVVEARRIRAATQSRRDIPLEQAGEALIDAYHLARFLLTRMGYFDLAWLVADRPIGILAQSEQSILIAVSSWHVASALLSLGYHAESRDYALAASRRLAETPLSAELQSSTYGALQLVAAEAAAGAGDLATSDDLLEQATRGAEQLGSTLHRTVWFGIPEVAITGMAIAVQLGRFDEAIRLSGGVNIPKEASVDLRVRYYLTTAYAYSQKGEDFAAAIALLEAERACPEDIRFDWMAHRTLQKLARRDHHLIRGDLAHLLAHAGLM